MNQACVHDAVRTPFDKLDGALPGHLPDALAALEVRTLAERTTSPAPARNDEVALGRVNGAGDENRNAIRTATVLAGMPVSAPDTTATRLCGSSPDAAAIASRQIGVGAGDMLLVGAGRVDRLPGGGHRAAAREARDRP